MLVNLIRMDMKKNRWDYLVLFLHSTIIFSLCNAFSSLQRGNYLLRFCNSQDFLSGFYFSFPKFLLFLMVILLIAEVYQALLLQPPKNTLLFRDLGCSSSQIALLNSASTGVVFLAAGVCSMILGSLLNQFLLSHLLVILSIDQSTKIVWEREAENALALLVIIMITYLLVLVCNMYRFSQNRFQITKLVSTKLFKTKWSERILFVAAFLITQLFGAVALVYNSWGLEVILLCYWIYLYFYWKMQVSAVIPYQDCSRGYDRIFRKMILRKSDSEVSRHALCSFLFGAGLMLAVFGREFASLERDFYIVCQLYLMSVWGGSILIVIALLLNVSISISNFKSEKSRLKLLVDMGATREICLKFLKKYVFIGIGKDFLIACIQTLLFFGIYYVFSIWEETPIQQIYWLPVFGICGLVVILYLLAIYHFFRVSFETSMLKNNH